MTERRSDRSPPPPERDPHDWDARGIAHTLGAEAEVRLDEVHGVGTRLRLGDPPAIDLDLFPVTHTVRLTAGDLAVSLVQRDPPTVAPEGIVFADRHRVFSLSPSGSATLVFNPAPGVAESAQTVSTVPERPVGRTPEIAPLTGHPGPPNAAPGPALGMTRGDGEREKQERVTVYGRLATDVRFKTHAAGRLIGEFVLAERIDEHQTHWHRVAAFDNPQTKRLIASKLKEQVDAGELGKGKPASVVGYRHATERTKKDGTTTTEEHIYAVAISPR